MRAIDADALKEDLTRFYDNEVTARKLIDEQPTIQPDNNSENPNGSDVISRQAAIDALKGCYCGGEDSCGEPWIYEDNAIKAVEQLPPIQPKIGKWVLVCDNNGMHFICNKCGAWRYHQEQNFCGECGAKMEVTE